jgi:aldehyde dehydrogenase (NAD+)
MAYSFASKGVYVGGEWQSCTTTEAVINPADESVITQAPVGTRAQAEAAIACARKSFDQGDWRNLPARDRQKRLQIFLDAIQARSAEIIDLIVAEAGSTRMLAELMQFGIPMRHAQYYIDQCTRPSITPLAPEVNQTHLGEKWLGAGVSVRAPIGVVTAITPYNFPFFLNLGKIIPALAVGCSVILKPSPYTPLQALVLGDIADEAGLPKGILSIVTGGNDVGECLSSDPRVDLVTFTGSDKVGALIQSQAAPSLKRCLLELGGKSAMIVRPDADIGRAAMDGLAGFTIHCGQGCALLTRHIVHNSVRGAYVESLKAMAPHMKVGNPSDPSVMMGPLIREAQRQRTEDFVEAARDEGARLVFGGKRPDGLNKGFYYEATLFDDVKNDHKLAQNEVFGPVGAVIGYDTDEEAIALANDSQYGLSGAIYSADVGTAYEMALQLQTGGVSINGGTGTMSSNFPFGGIKRSGYGREYGEEGLNEFTYIKTIGFHGG